MKTIPQALQDELDSGATTLCTCWKITRIDNAIYGFTNHDNRITFDDVNFEPDSGFTGSDLSASLGLAVDSADVTGALSSEQITEEDISLGLWDNSLVEIWRVDWKDPTRRVILRRGSFGEISRGEIAYMAEVRSLAYPLDQETGRVYGRLCDVSRLGDSRCKANVEDPAFKGTGTVISSGDSILIIADGLGAYQNDWFARGLMTWLTGNNAGAESEVRSHIVDGGSVRLQLWQASALSIQAGDTFTVVAGCDRRWETCLNKFANSLNFRGFPHIPGNDFALGVAKREEIHDGGSFFR